VELVDEIPKSPSGKILRRLLRADRATLARSDDEGGHGRLTLDLVPARVVFALRFEGLAISGA
jgi:acyl-CoA synthetase (AMP-forming)/AMP-acid ligase II